MDMTELDLTPFENAVSQLAEAIELNDSDIVREHPRLKNHMRAAAIQAFEFTYELSFNMIKRHLRNISANPAAVGGMSFRHIHGLAYRHGIVSCEYADWDQFRSDRGATSHLYDEEKAEEVFQSASMFLDEARHVLVQLKSLN